MTTVLKNIPKPLLNDVVIGRCIPIIGTGFSCNAVLPPGEKMPLWNELGKGIAELLPNYPYTTPIDAISAFCHEYSRTKLIEELNKLLHIGSAQPGLAHKAFSKVPFDIACTTNFDFLLEKAYELKSGSFYCRTIIEQEQLSITPPEPGVLLIKMHGDLNHPSRLIVTEEDYDTFFDRYPLLSTYLGNLLITRTPLFFGYSLDDPDFRQIWQIIGNRLGKMRRPAYVFTIDISSSEVARYERRGVKVINLPGKKEEYNIILEGLFNELRAYWSTNLLKASIVTNEESLSELTLPEEAITRICFFAIPSRLHSLYKSLVFPIIESFGLVPMTTENLISPGDNLIVKILALIDRAEIVVADASSPMVLREIELAYSRKPKPPKILVILEDGFELPIDLKNVQYIRRPRDLYLDSEKFLTNLEDEFQKLIEELSPKFFDEPMRLLDKKEYRAAVISAFTQLEDVLRELSFTYDLNLIKGKLPLISLNQMLIAIANKELITYKELETLKSWINIRNRLVHTNAHISLREANKIVKGIMEIITRLKNHQPFFSK